jgi:hypothetical protein
LGLLCVTGNLALGGFALSNSLFDFVGDAGIKVDSINNRLMTFYDTRERI